MSYLKIKGVDKLEVHFGYAVQAGDSPTTVAWFEDLQDADDFVNKICPPAPLPQPTLRERLITAAMGTPIPGWFEPRSREITRISQWPIAYADMVLAELADEEDAPTLTCKAIENGKAVSDEE